MTWWKRAACREVAKETFYPSAGQGRMDLQRLRAAQEICNACSVRETCRADATSRRETQGVWGGREFGTFDRQRHCRGCQHLFWGPPPVLYCSNACEVAAGIRPLLALTPPGDRRWRIPGAPVVAELERRHGNLSHAALSKYVNVRPETIAAWRSGGYLRDLVSAATVARWLRLDPSEIWEEWPAA